MNILLTVVFLALSFFAGIFALLIHNELKIILLFITGYFLALVAQLMNVEIDSAILLYFAFIAFSLYIFEHAPKLRFRHVSYEEKISFHYSLNSLIASLVAGYLAYLLTAKPLLYVFAFSLMMFVSQLSYFRKNSRIAHILEYESNTSVIFALVVLFAVFDAHKLILGQEYWLLSQKILLSIGLAILAALLLLRFASRKSHHKLASFVILMILFVVSQIVALPGFSIAIAAILFDTFSTKRTAHTFDFFKNLNNVAEVFICIFAGYLFAMNFNLTQEFILLSLTIYAIFFFTRFAITSLFAVSWREKVFISLNNPKGAIGALLFILLILTAPRYAELWMIFFVQIIISELISFVSHYLEDPNTF